MAKLALFDIDGTLINVFNSHRNAFRHAFKKILNLDFSLEEWTYSGCTDLQIIHEFMDSNGVKKKPEVIEKIVRCMIDYFMEQDLSKAVMFPGVTRLLKELSERDDVILALLTGNIEEIAYAKLRHFKIDEYFLFGGFGGTTPVRSELVDFARKEAEKHHKIKIGRKDIIIIGDTPRDIEAARKARIKVIAVSTGNYDRGQLRDEKPDYLFENLEDTEKVIEAITNG